MIMTLCLLAVAGFGLGLTVRWPILALVAFLVLIGVAGALAWTGHGVLASIGWAFASLLVLELGFLAGSVLTERDGLESGSAQPAPAHEAWNRDPLSGGKDLG
ncbi:hypothetical protein [Microvirga pudoricolor]|uniref:hypothetical protein n=1 Tax=Microvirga pudoricolor TaxID=2778729 RepID=UPI00195031DD|nr:hypothetical protein [Microvirga pudoricolor]MBM6593254.1 hypothetical protein [Microvirga pudoricolor]